MIIYKNKNQTYSELFDNQRRPNIHSDYQTELSGQRPHMYYQSNRPTLWLLSVDFLFSFLPVLFLLRCWYSSAWFWSYCHPSPTSAPRPWNGTSIVGEQFLWPYTCRNALAVHVLYRQIILLTYINIVALVWKMFSWMSVCMYTAHWRLFLVPVLQSS